MKNFVLVYDRQERKPLELRTFPDSQFEAATAFRLKEQQRALREGLDREIVLFHANSEEALRRTHGAYFLTEGELLDRLASAADAATAKVGRRRRVAEVTT